MYFWSILKLFEYALLVQSSTWLPPLNAELYHKSYPRVILVTNSWWQNPSPTPSSIWNSLWLKLSSDTKFDSTIFYINQKNWSTIIICLNIMIITMALKTMIFTGIPRMVFISNLKSFYAGHLGSYIGWISKMLQFDLEPQLGVIFGQQALEWKPCRSVVIRF